MMRLLFSSLFRLAAPALVLLPAAAFAQSWEVGVDGGWGFPTDKTVTAGSASGSAGFKTGFAAGAYATQHLFEHFSGEVRYTFRDATPQISSGGTTVGFSGQAHAIHYDLLYSPAPRDAKVRPYLAGGAGVKVFRGTADEMIVQPLQQLAVYTRTSDTQPLISVGGGVAVAVSRRGVFRLDVRDYITPFPTKLIAPVPNATLSGWIHDFVILAGFGVKF
jgi:hypothetical protein